MYTEQFRRLSGVSRTAPAPLGAGARTAIPHGVLPTRQGGIGAESTGKTPGRPDSSAQTRGRFQLSRDIDEAVRANRQRLRGFRAALTSCKELLRLRVSPLFFGDEAVGPVARQRRMQNVACIWRNARKASARSVVTCAWRRRGWLWQMSKIGWTEKFHRCPLAQGRSHNDTAARSYRPHHRIRDLGRDGNGDRDQASAHRSIVDFATDQAYLAIAEARMG